MWSELITDNKPQCVHTDFDPEVVEKSKPKPMIGSQPLLKKECCCLSGPTSQLLMIMFPSQSRKNKRNTQGI